MAWLSRAAALEKMRTAEAVSNGMVGGDAAKQWQREQRALAGYL